MAPTCRAGDQERSAALRALAGLRVGGLKNSLKKIRVRHTNNTNNNNNNDNNKTNNDDNNMITDNKKKRKNNNVY